jgi:hypothetical protein
MTQLVNIIFIGLVSLSFGCSKATFGTNTLKSLSHGKTRTFSNGEISFSIKFMQLVKESRCPPNAQCVHAGQAVVRVKIDDKVTHLGLQSTEYPSSIDYKGHTIHLMDILYKQGQPFGTQHNAYLIVKVE